MSIKLANNAIAHLSASLANTDTTGITIGNNTGGGGAHNNMQPSIVVQFIIKVQ